jgi:hypothetical protein
MDISLNSLQNLSKRGVIQKKKKCLTALKSGVFELASDWSK